MSRSDRIMKGLEGFLTPIAEKVGENKHIMAIRDGFVSAMPFLIVGSLLLVLAFPPFTEETTFGPGKLWIEFAKNHKNEILLPFNMTMGIMGVFVTISTAYSLLEAYKLDRLTGSLLALMCYLMVASPVTNGAMHTGFLGSKGVFTALIAAVFSVELFRFCIKRKLTIKLPSGVPPRIAKSFELLIPVFFLVLIVYPLSIVTQKYAGVLIPELIMSFFKPLVMVTDSLPGMLLAVLLTSTLWFMGIHVSVVTGILYVFLYANVGFNQEALLAGESMTKIFTHPFWAAYVALGGAGATLSLAFMFTFSKAKHIRTIGRLSIIPSIFNINEPLLFGAPLTMNPIFYIPMVLAPAVNLIIAYVVLSLGLVPMSYMIPPWTVPAPFLAMWAAGWNIKAFILALVLLAVSGIIWYPFMKLYEKQMLAKEHEIENEEEVSFDDL